jgi:hypothetical protein
MRIVSGKQTTFGLPSCILLLMWPMPSSFFCTVMISLFKMGVRVILNDDKSGNTRVMDSSPVRHIAGR